MDPERLIKCACQAFGLSRAELMGDCKRFEFAHPRILLMWRMTKMKHASLPRIGRIMGRHHTTVMNARDKVQERIAARDPHFMRLADRLEDSFMPTPERLVGPDFRIVPTFGDRPGIPPLFRTITPREYV